MYTITEIEDAIISTLKGSTMNSYCKKIDSYQIEGGDLEEQIRLFSGQLPCVLVVYKEGTFDYFLAGGEYKEMKFSILVCAQNMRGSGEARRSVIGTYQMLDDLRVALTGNACGLSIHPLSAIIEVAEINTKMFSAYSMEFLTRVF